LPQPGRIYCPCPQLDWLRLELVHADCESNAVYVVIADTVAAQQGVRLTPPGVVLDGVSSLTIASLPNLPHEVSDIWLRQITDESGFEIIYVAALRSVGIPARLYANRYAEIWDGNKWQTAPEPSVLNW